MTAIILADDEDEGKGEYKQAKRTLQTDLMESRAEIADEVRSIICA